MLPLLLSAFGLGAAHALEPDHMAAVSSFVANRPTPKQALKFGLQWAVGHGLSLLVFGLALFLLKRAISQPAIFESGVLERIVGVVLVLLGAWSLWQLFSGKARATHHHGHFHDGHFHTHSHDEEPNTKHKHGKGLGSLWMGMLHGAAGTGAFIGETAAALSGSFFTVFLYTLLFSVGVLFAMSVYAALLGTAFSWGEKKSQVLLTGARALTGLATIAIGVCFVQGIELPGLFSFATH